LRIGIVWSQPESVAAPAVSLKRANADIGTGDAALSVMRPWRIPRWALPVALGGVVAIAGADAFLLRRHPISVPRPAISEKIGLRADSEGGSLRVEWNRASRPIRDADRAVLYIEDGSLRSHVNLTGLQLDRSTVLYSPETDRVSFRLEVYHGDLSSCDSADCNLPRNAIRHRRPATKRAIVEQARPSPFELVRPEIVTTQTLPPRVVPADESAVPQDPAPQPGQAAEPRDESQLGRMLSKIPLLRRLEKHPQSDETGQR
jgi:hypothetical protein